MKRFKIRKGSPYPLGAKIMEDGINFSMVNCSDEECGIVLYRKGVEQKERIKFDNNHRIGNICCLFIEGLALKDYEYNFYIGDKIFVDPYAKRICGNEKWRSGEFVRPVLRGALYNSEFEWENTSPLHIPYHNTIMYCLHMRGFTRHSSSKVKHKGTFMGLMEKIPYLKELGINSVELMPVYEFEECEWKNDEELANSHSIEYQVEHYDEPIEDKETVSPIPKKLNYWGYREGYYFAPKASYAYGDNPCLEFKQLVKELHKNGIEVIMQFYFPDNIKQGFILEILKHWVIEYQIDGVHFKGDKIPVTLIATEPLFANTKIMYDHFDLQEIYPTADGPVFKNLGYYRDEFMYDCRRFLKSDRDMLANFQYHMRNHHNQCGIINYMANYYGFTINDMVTYSEKHNDDNGENNSDGTDYNCSWNCGAEGSSRKKAINQLRKRQIKNAITFLFTAQGTPLLMAGDEFGNSQNGNNNCYCQDNEIGWVDWKGLTKNVNIYEYTRKMIEFRKKHDILHFEKNLSTLDSFGYGCPDLSYHGEEAWKVNLEGSNRHIGIMYCGNKAGAAKDSKPEADYIFIAYNMHWESHKFALPSISKHKWAILTETSDFIPEKATRLEIEETSYYVTIPARSILILVGEKFEPIIKTKTKSKTKTEVGISAKNTDINKEPVKEESIIKNSIIKESVIKESVIKEPQNEIVKPEKKKIKNKEVINKSVKSKKGKK